MHEWMVDRPVVDSNGLVPVAAVVVPGRTFVVVPGGAVVVP